MFLLQKSTEFVVKYLTIILLALTMQINAKVPLDTITVDLSSKPKKLNSFMNCTGFSPIDIIMREEMRYILKDVGSLPGKGISYVRPHYMLNLVEIKGMDTDSPSYNWSKLDNALDIITQNNLKMIFELMGFPADLDDTTTIRYDANYQEQLVRKKSYFNNLKEKEQIIKWKQFIKNLALHLIERYGKEEIQSWYFETTNEPDLEQFWKYDIETFLNYYDTCSQGLKEADPAIKFGGPGTARDLSPTFKELLAHCDTGTNFFTGKKGIRLDFISFHAKELPRNMVNRSLKIFDYIKTYHPKFISKPIFNDEADPTVGWSIPFWWRSGPWYAAFIAQNIDLHQKILIDSAKVNLTLLSNDHTFVGDWNMRTTHNLFTNPNNPKDFILIKKPALTVMNLIGAMGNLYFDVNIPDSISSHFGIIPTLKGDSVVVLVYNKTDMVIKTPNRSPKPEPDFENDLMKKQFLSIELKIKGQKSKSVQIDEYRIDETHGNPYHEWVKMGKPEFPDNEQLQVLKHSEIPPLVRSEKIILTDKEFSIPIVAPSSSVSLLVIVPAE